ncbi:MAG: hypothetical protein P8H03_03310, partial [Emcibacteraceae bacterium]|nr:hypothetical protein [Emcibacteraceae bacterium]
MRKSIYVVSGIIALTIAGVAVSQDRGRDRGMSEMDTDGNGTVEKSEFIAMFDKRYAETDSNGNGISIEEYKARSDADRAERAERRSERRAEKKSEKEEKRAERSEERAEKDAKRLQERFDRLDENSDGTVTADEYKAAG